MKATINSTNIQYYLQQHEGETLEFKSKFTSDKQICSVISAFANTKGGILIIGFHEKEGVIGVSANDINLIPKAFSLLTNPPEYITYNVSFDNKLLLIVEVKKSTNSLTSFRGALLFRKDMLNEYMPSNKIKEHFSIHNDSSLPKEVVNILSEMNLRIKNLEIQLKYSNLKNLGYTILGAVISLALTILYEHVSS